MRFSADDVLGITVPSHLRGYELVDGELVEVTPVTFVHGCLAAEITIRLGDHVRQHGIRGYVCIEGGYKLRLPRDPERLRGPDVSFVTGATLDAHGGVPSQGFIDLVPDLVVEVDSPDRRPSVEQQRIQDYLDAGVRLLWIVHTATASATVYQSDGSARILREADALEGQDVLPGFRLPLNELFERIPPETSP